MLFLGDPLCGSRPNFTADFLDVEVEDKLPTGRFVSSWCGCRCGQPLPKFASQRGNNPSSISDSAVFQSSPEPRRNSFIRSSVTHLSPGQRSAGIHTHRATSAPSAFVACINSSVVFPSVPFGPRHTRTQADTRACTHAHTHCVNPGCSSKWRNGASPLGGASCSSLPSSPKLWPSYCSKTTPR